VEKVSFKMRPIIRKTGAYMSEVTIGMDNFNEEALQSPLPVLIDFWAAWCGPCRMIAPLIADIAREYEGRLKVGKVNVDEEDELARQHGIVSIPCLVVYKDGKIVRKHMGAAPKQTVEELFKDLL
jgi:thioredoxin 1